MSTEELKLRRFRGLTAELLSLSGRGITFEQRLVYLAAAMIRILFWPAVIAGVIALISTLTKVGTFTEIWLPVFVCIAFGTLYATIHEYTGWHVHLRELEDKQKSEWYILREEANAAHAEAKRSKEEAEAFRESTRREARKLLALVEQITEAVNDPRDILSAEEREHIVEQIRAFALPAEEDKILKRSKELERELAETRGLKTNAERALQDRDKQTEDAWAEIRITLKNVIRLLWESKEKQSGLSDVCRAARVQLIGFMSHRLTTSYEFRFLKDLGALD